MPDALIDFVQGEHDYLHARTGSEFFLALKPYTDALEGRPKIAVILTSLEVETREALNSFEVEQNEMIEEAKAIRVTLAKRAPEIDNSGMEEPDPGSGDRARYDLDRLAKFDQLAEAENAIGYPLVPEDDNDLPPVPRLLIILRGRFNAATLGEDAGIDAQAVRDDLDDLGRRIGNLGERHRASVQQFRQDARTLPGIAYARLSSFGSGLVGAPLKIEGDEDILALLDRTLRELFQPKTVVRKLVNGERLDDFEQRSIVEIETTLKGESERLHRELLRRLQREPSPTARAWAYIGQHAIQFVVAVAATVAGALILLYLFGIGTSESTQPPRTTPSTITSP